MATLVDLVDYFLVDQMGWGKGIYDMVDLMGDEKPLRDLVEIAIQEVATTEEWLRDMIQQNHGQTLKDIVPEVTQSLRFKWMEASF